MSSKTNYSKFLYEDYEKTQNKLDAVLEELSSIRKCQRMYTLIIYN